MLVSQSSTDHPSFMVGFHTIIVGTDETLPSCESRDDMLQMLSEVPLGRVLWPDAIWGILRPIIDGDGHSVAGYKTRC